MPIAPAIRNAISELGNRHVQQMLMMPFTLPFAVSRFVREQPSLDAVKAELLCAMRTREKRFLDLVRDRVYGVPDSPYKKLLDHAGCTLADIASGLDRQGLEATLEELAGAGVYLMPEEAKGRRDVVRGSLSFRLQPNDLTPPNQFGKTGGVTQSSGSSGKPRSGTASTDWWREEALSVAIYLQAHGLLSHRLAVYEPILGSLAGGLRFLLHAARLGIPGDRCFVRPTPANNWLEALYFKLTAHEIALTAHWFGPGFAWPETIPPERIDRIVRWVEQCRRAGENTCIRTVASNAARIARVANDIGASLEGCTFVASGEPMTPGKRRTIEKAGAAIAMLWGYMPIGIAGLGCARPTHDSEMHLLRHSMAAIEHPQPILRPDGETVRPLLFTTLFPFAPELEINISNGDRGVLSERDCGCPLHAAGLTHHIHGIGSFEKLTSEGLAFSFDDIFELIEVTLPERFGGSVGDYQLREEEASGGEGKLSLLVDPSVGPLDEAAVLRFLTEALASGSRNNLYMTNIWHESGTLRVLREAPETSPRGKILPIRKASRID